MNNKRLPQILSLKVRYAGARLAKRYCEKYTDMRSIPPACRSCSLVVGYRDCHKNPLGYRDYLCGQAMMKEYDELALIQMSKKE